MLGIFTGNAPYGKATFRTFCGKISSAVKGPDPPSTKPGQDILSEYGPERCAWPAALRPPPHAGATANLKLTFYLDPLSGG